MLDSPHRILSFGEDADGELYITTLSGQVLKIAALPSAASAVVGGRVANSEGRGIGGVVLTMSGGNLTAPIIVRTNPFGYYRFSEVEVGQTYVVTPTAKNRRFAPSNRVFTALENVSDIDFSAK